MRNIQLLPVLLLLVTAAAAQDLPCRWDELTASDWPRALERSSRTCILPTGILEKHGPHAPIGSDLIQVREWAARATKKEYAVVFPDYFYGQINEAKHEPGAFALPEKVVWELLESTCDKSDPATDGHAGERETSVLLYMWPELVKMDSARIESGANQRRLSVPGVYTAI
ncbi:MAG TPA: creatininase family protein [Puia sp.]|jgi:creatinine amidohydrolase/Fe(II)-dependent formamide hydrolase-like protein|nr:creatininase family protein [Puia sp.]